MRWSMRLTGMLSIVILARLLHPEDFGILAMASILIGAFSNFTGVGVGAMLIREAQVSDADMDTAWTIKLIQGFLLAVLVAASAHPAAQYFREPRLTDVVYVCAIAILIGSFGNIGTVLIRKELDFAKDFRYHLISRFVGSLITIALALLLRSYWALALARPIGAVFGVGFSYAMHPYRPWFSLKSYRRFYRFSLFVVLANVARFITNKADVFLVGSTGTPTQMGLYNVAADLSSIPATEITSSVGRAMFPSLARFKRDGADRLALNATFLRIIGSVVAMCLPLGLGMWVVADDFVRVVFGERWAGAAELMAILGVYGTLTALVNISIGHVLIVTGHEYRQAVALWIRCTLLVGCALVGMQWGMKGIAIGALVSGVIMFFVAIWFLKVTLGCSVRDFVRIYWRPTIASVLMVLIVHYAVLAMATLPAWLRLLSSVGIGAASYVTVLLVLWLAAGRPEGAESGAMDVVFKRTAAGPK